MKLSFWPGFALVVALVGGVYLWNPFGVPSLDPRPRLFGVTPYSIPAQDMSPTLQRGDIILVSAASLALNAPVVGDIMVFISTQDPSMALVKRIAAGPGDRIRITDGRIFLNDHEESPPYLQAEWNRMAFSREMAEHQVPAGHYFMLGDYRDDSLDSRNFGDVPRANLIGRVTRILYAQDSQRTGALPETQP